MNKTRRMTAVLLVVCIVFALAGCGSETNQQEAATGTAISDERMDSAEVKAYREYLAEREDVSDLYFTYLYIGQSGQAVLALTHEKNAVKTEDDYITASHIVLNNYVDGEVVQVAGSSMDSFSNTSEISYAEGKMWVPVYGGTSCYTVNKDKIEGNVYTTEAGNSTTYQVKGKKRTEPENTDSATVTEMTGKQNNVAIPLKFYRNTAENREKYL